MVPAQQHWLTPEFVVEVVCEMGLKYHRMRQTQTDRQRERGEIWREIGGYCSLADKWTLDAVVVN
jgi:hypothetical protein